MKKITIFVVIAIIIGIVLPIGGCTDKDDKTAPDGWQPENQNITYERNPDVNDPLRVGVANVNLPPMIMWDREGNLTGFETELIAETAKRLGVGYEIVPIEPGSEAEMLENGTIDCAWGNISDAGAQAAGYIMTGAYIAVPQAVLVYEGSGVTGKKDIENLAVVMSTPAEYFADEDMLGIELNRVSASRDYEKTFSQLAEGHSDAAVCDMTLADYMRGTDGKIILLEETSVKAGYSAAFRKADEKMMKAADQALADILGDGILSSLSQKWFGRDYLK